MICKNLVTKLPKILQRRYNINPYSDNKLVLNGVMNITMSRMFRIFSPFFRIVGALTPYSGNNIPVDITLISNRNSPFVLMHRIFYYKNRPPYHFSSKMLPIKDNEIIELTRFRIGIKLLYRLENNKIIMDYGGYIFYLGKWSFPLPLHYIIGKFSAYEKAENDEIFNMQVNIVHTFFGKIFECTGKFKIDSSND